MEKTMCELFAGVGGFRLGMERLDSGWRTVWFNQWEPGKRKQWAHDCYLYHFGDCKDVNGEIHTGEDISTVKKEAIPDHTLLMAGFPCQDYSVAHTKASGIEGKKGVLWWQIRDVIIAKRPPFCLFENVDRLLKSPAKQRGRDFGVILACLNELGYSAEWRVINAAEYGSPQRRKRTFIFACRNDTRYGVPLTDRFKEGLMAKAFPVQSVGEISSVSLPDSVLEASDTFAFPFENAGYTRDGTIITARVKAKTEPQTPLMRVLEDSADESFFISEDKLPKWEYLKGAKKVSRTAANGHKYIFSEGAIPFPDPTDKPARTMLTSESIVNRSSHVIKDRGRLRTLTPVEAERLDGFDDDWTLHTVNGDMPTRMRYFCMGNALVVPMIARIGKVLDEIVADEP